MSVYKYDHTYSDDIGKEFERAIMSPDEIEKYSFEVEDGFRQPPILDCIKLFSYFTSDDFSDEADALRDKVLHHCLLNRSVTLYLDGAKVGSVLVSNITDSWDAFDVFTDHPIGFSLIRNSALWYVVGKFKPSLKKEIPGQAMAVKAIKK